MRLMEIMTPVNAASLGIFWRVVALYCTSFDRMAAGTTANPNGLPIFLIGQSPVCGVTRRAGTGRLHMSRTMGGVCTKASISE
ncbi:MAG: putative transcriptional regulator [Hyphomonas sp.]|jgi:predicted transcriptional regulator